ncbi:MAG: hypothetical protein WBA57_05380 [Elainellaceae cyanobacterium]
MAPLITALGAAYIYEKFERSSEEIAIVCVAVALVGVVLTVISAPWPIQFLLAAILLAFRLLNAQALDG